MTYFPTNTGNHENDHRNSRDNHQINYNFLKLKKKQNFSAFLKGFTLLKKAQY